jgi:hypothetical protein
MLHVEIRETGGERRRWVSRHQTTNPTLAVNRAINKHFGSAAFFRRSETLRPTDRTMYGQIFRQISRAPFSATAITDAVAVLVN